VNDVHVKPFGRPRVLQFVIPLATAVAFLLVFSALAGASTPAPRASASATGSHPSGVPPPSSATNVTVGKQPNGVTVDAANGHVFVPNEGSASVSVISGTSVLKTIHVGKDPLTVTYDPSNTLLYVYNSGSDNVSVINGSTDKVVQTVHSLTGYGASVYDPSNGAVYLMTAFGFSTYSKLARLPTASPWTAKTVTVGKEPLYVTYDPATMDIVTSNRGSNNLSVVSSSTNTVKTVALTVGSDPDWMVYSPKNKDLYVLDDGATVAHPKNGNVTVLGSGNTIVSTLKVGPGPLTASFDPDNNEIYVVNDTAGGPHITNSTVTPITSTNSVKTAIKVGQGAFFATYDPTNKRLYVAEADSNVTAVIDTSTNKVLTSVTTKGTPEIGFYDPGTTDILVLLETSASVAGRLTILSSPTSGNPVVLSTQVLGKDPTGYGYDSTNSEIYVANAGSNTVTVF
jgi:YVTN family beta-propeller protein